MKRLLSLLLVFSLFAGTVAGLTPGRTVINGEDSPLRYLFIPQEDAPANTTDPDQLVALLHEGAEEILFLPPKGMWRIPATSGVLVGFFIDGSVMSGLRLVAMELPEGTDPILAVAMSHTIIDGEPSIGFEDLPHYREPVFLDGGNDDWEGVSDIMLRDVTSPPQRSVAVPPGEDIHIADARSWHIGGTGLKSIQATSGDRAWYVSIGTFESITDGTFYHFRLFTTESRGVSAGELVIPVKEQSGPVIFRTVSDEIELVGQYVRDGSFLECMLNPDAIVPVREGTVRRDWVVDVVTSRRNGTQREYFTLDTISIQDVADL